MTEIILGLIGISAAFLAGYMVGLVSPVRLDVAKEAKHERD